MVPRSRRLSTEVEAQIDRCERDTAAQAKAIDALSKKLLAVTQLIESSDAVPLPVEDEDSLVIHVEEARDAAQS
jgi:hypothetical protein